MNEENVRAYLCTECLNTITIKEVFEQPSSYNPYRDDSWVNRCECGAVSIKITTFTDINPMITPSGPFLRLTEGEYALLLYVKGQKGGK